MKDFILGLFTLLLSYEITSAQNIKKDIAYGDDPKQKMDAYLPQTKAKAPAIILIHGGSWISGDKVNMVHWLKPLQDQFPDYAVFTLNYRLASRKDELNKWPTQIDDVDKAVSFIKNKAKDYNISKNQLILIGESAGAQLALVEGFNRNKDHAVKVVVDLFGPADMTDLYQAHQELGILMNGSPKTIPAVYAAASAVKQVDKRSPATIIFHGTADPIVPIRESDSLHVALKKADVPVKYIIYPGKAHGWRGEELQDTYTKTIDFIKMQIR